MNKWKGLEDKVIWWLLQHNSCIIVRSWTIVGRKGEAVFGLLLVTFSNINFASVCCILYSVTAKLATLIKCGSLLSTGLAWLVATEANRTTKIITNDWNLMMLVLKLLYLRASQISLVWVCLSRIDWYIYSTQVIPSWCYFFNGWNKYNQVKYIFFIQFSQI
jgi:hypothetical protein